LPNPAQDWEALIVTNAPSPPAQEAGDERSSARLNWFFCRR
jgi:hypothetical protein